MFVTGYAHPPSILDGRYNGPHLRKAEIKDLIKNKKYIVGKPVLYDHKEEPIGKVVDIDSKTINSQYGEADALVVSMIITDDTKRGTETMEGIRNGKLNFLSVHTWINDFEKHEKGYIDWIRPVEVSIVENPHRLDCNIIGYTEDGKAFPKSQINSFHVYMDPLQATESSSRLQPDEQGVSKKAKIMNNISDLLGEEEAANMFDELSRVKKEEAEFINEQVKSISEASKIPVEQWEKTPNNILSFVCAANAKTAELEASQKALMEKLKNFEKETAQKQQQEAAPNNVKGLLPPSTIASLVNNVVKPTRSVVPYSSLNLNRTVNPVSDPLLS